MERRRTDRVSNLIKEEISNYIIKEIKDPRIKFVTILRVAVSPDMHNAKVYYSVYGDEEEKKQAAKGLESASEYMRRLLKKSIVLKWIPKLNFIYDDSIEYASKIEELLKKV